MRFIADLHIHSKYSRATSKNMILEELDARADDKGILVIGTGDFTHPGWLKEIKKKLEPAEPGLFRLKPAYKKETIKKTKANTRFLLTAEISNIFSRRLPFAGQNKTYRIHNLIFAPDIKTVETINTQLSRRGKLTSDGRPILGIDVQELAKIIVNTNPQAAIIPAHAWTPWFSIFGSMSGFNSIEDCFGDYSRHIFALETGLSSDPAMNWRLSKLDKIALISNSDAHSLTRVGREANIFNAELSYNGLIAALKERDPKKFLGTIEFFPEEGKYHFDGHRDCGVVLSPKETKQHDGLCPKCGRPLTIGVMNRVEQLADRPEGFILKTAPKYKNLVPLNEIIAEAFNQKIGTKKVNEEYRNLIMTFGNEIKILLETSTEELNSAKILPTIIEGIKRVRDGQLLIRPGFDGEYGKTSIFSKEKSKAIPPSGNFNNQLKPFRL